MKMSSSYEYSWNPPETGSEYVVFDNELPTTYYVVMVCRSGTKECRSGTKEPERPKDTEVRSIRTPHTYRRWTDELGHTNRLMPISTLVNCSEQISRLLVLGCGCCSLITIEREHNLMHFVYIAFIATLIHTINVLSN
jgi:hypothetical protein